MKKRIVIALLICTMLSLSACGNITGPTSSKEIVEEDDKSDDDDKKDKKKKKSESENEDRKKDSDERNKDEDDKKSNDNESENDDDKKEKDSKYESDDGVKDNEKKSDNNEMEKEESDKTESEKEDNNDDTKDSDIDVSLISKKWQDNEILLEGNPITLTEYTIQDLIDSGWEIDEEIISEEMEPMAYSMSSVYLEKDGNEFSVQVYNPNETETVSVLECNISSIKVEDWKTEDFTTVIFSNGVMLGIHENDVTILLGEPTNISDGDSYTIYTYKESVYKKLEIKVDTETGLVDRVQYTFLEDYR